MKNFGILFGYELRKIVQSKVTIITVALMLFIMLLNAGVFTERTEAEKLVKEQQMQIDGRLVDEALLGEMAAVLNEYGEKEWTADNQTYQELYYFASNVVGKVPISEYTAERLYAQRAENLTKIFQQEYIRDGVGTEAEVSYWMEKEAEVSKPFVWRYTKDAKHILVDLSSVAFLSRFLAAIALAGVFAGERHYRTEPIILSTRYGRKTIYYAKVAAGWVFQLTVTVGMTGVLIWGTNSRDGLDGLDAALQLYLPYVAKALSFREAIGIMIGLLLTSSLFWAEAAIILSERLGNSLAAMGMVIGSYFVVTFLYHSVPSHFQLLRHMIALCPTMMNDVGSFYEYQLIGIAGHYLTAYQVAPVLYMGIAVVLVLFGSRWYQRR